MLETPHVIVAAAIASKVGNPLISLPLAFGSHFLLERVPHWNPHLNTEMAKFKKVTKNSFLIVLIDSGMALILGGLIAYLAFPDINRALTILAACFLGALPDVLEAPYYFLNHKGYFIEKMYIPFKKSIQSDTGLFWGLITQVVVVILAFYWILA